MSSSSSTTRTRGAREKSFIDLYVSGGCKAMVRAREAGSGRRRRSCAGWPAPASAPRRRANARARRRSRAGREPAPARARASAARSRRLAGAFARRLPRLPRARPAPARRPRRSRCRARRVHGLRPLRSAGRRRAAPATALAVALGWTLGGARVLAPVALVLGGGALLLRPVLPALRPLRTGALCLFAAVTLALAAGTLGVSSGPGAGSAAVDLAHLQSHGGVARARRSTSVAHRLVQDGRRRHPRRLPVARRRRCCSPAPRSRACCARPAAACSTRRAWCARSAEREAPPSAAAGPRADAPRSRTTARLRDAAARARARELIVRATHVEAPSRDWEHAHETRCRRARSTRRSSCSPTTSRRGRAPDCRGATSRTEDEEDEQIAGVARADAGRRSRRRAGCATRSPTTPTSSGSCRDAGALLTRSSAEQTRPDTAGQERTSRRASWRRSGTSACRRR